MKTIRKKPIKISDATASPKQKKTIDRMLREITEEDKNLDPSKLRKNKSGKR